jgi:glycosyltransferase involved in cell wall biosynthesis
MLMDSVAIIMPSFFEGAFLQKLVNEIRSELQEYSTQIVIVDDSGGRDKALQELQYSNDNLRVLINPFQMGSQKSICRGIALLIAEKIESNYVVIMDSDGEDRPVDIARLLHELKASSSDVVFAKRGKRHNSSIFKISLLFYKAIFFVLTGNKMDFSNFSAISMTWLKSVYESGAFRYLYSSECRAICSNFSQVLCDRGNRHDRMGRTSYQSLLLFSSFQLIPWFPSITKRIASWLTVSIIILPLNLGVSLYLKYIGATQPNWVTILLTGNSMIVLILMLMFLVSLSYLALSSEVGRKD